MAYPLSASTRINSLPDEVTFSVLAAKIAELYAGTSAMSIAKAYPFNWATDDITIGSLTAHLKANLSIPDNIHAPAGDIRVNSTLDKVSFGAVLKSLDTLGARGGPVEPAPIKSWQIIGQYNDIPQAQQGVNGASLRALTVAKAKLAATGVTALRAFGRGYYVGGNGGPEVPIGNDVPTRVAALNGNTLLGVSPAPVAIPNGSALTLLAEFDGLDLDEGTVLTLQKERILASGQFSTQTTPYAAGTLPTGIGRKGDDGTAPSALGTPSPASLSVGTLESDIWAAYGVHPAHTITMISHSIGYNNTDSNIGDGGLIGADGRTAEGGGLFRRGFRAAALATGVEIPLYMMAKPAGQMATFMADGARRKEGLILTNTIGLYLDTNDLATSAGNKTAAQLAAMYIALAAEHRANWIAENPGLTPYVFACTPLPRDADVGGVPSTTQQRIADFYALVVAGLEGFDGYWDLNSLFAVPGIPWKIANTSLFNADLLHLSPAGHAVGGAYVSNMLQQPVPWIPYTPAPVTPTIVFTSPTATITEGNSGTSTVANTINVTREGVTGNLVVNLTYSGTAGGGTDYVTGPSSVTILSGQNSVSFNLTINGDTTVESDETINIHAELAAYSTATATKVITITNDDSAAPPDTMTMAEFIDYMGSDLVALWDAADDTSLIRSGGVCTSWVDKISGITLPAVGSPTYSDTGLNANAPAAVFNGSSQYFATAAGALPAALPAGTAESWIFVLAKNTQADTNTRSVVAYGGTTNGANRVLRNITIGGIKRFQTSAGGGIAHVDTVANAIGEHIMGGQHRQGGTVIAARIDGVATTPESTTTAAWSTATSSALVVIGSSIALASTAHWQGAVSLVMILGPAVTTEKLQAVEGIMNARSLGEV